MQQISESLVLVITRWTKLWKVRFPKIEKWSAFGAFWTLQLDYHKLNLNLFATRWFHFYYLFGNNFNFLRY